MLKQLAETDNMASHPSNIARTSTLALGAAPLLWIAQAALLAGAVQHLADGAGVAGMLAPAAG